VEVPSLALDRSGPLTLEAYVTPTQTRYNKHAYLLGVLDQITLRINRDSGKWKLHTVREAGSDEIGPVRFVENRRVHIAGIRTGREHRLYLDGKQVKCRPAEGALVEPGHPFQLGSGFVGVLDEVRVSKVARYDRDFQPAPQFEPDPDTLALYHCDEGAGAVLTDSSGNNHHGRLIGVRWVPADAAQDPGPPPP
jgi:hypothetical protein